MSMAPEIKDTAPEAEHHSVERRAAPRHRCCIQCIVRPENANGVGDWKGIAYNISTSGIGMALPCPVSEGTVLLIEPWRWTGGHRLRARVVRIAPVSFLYFHGCEFLTFLTEAELQSLLGP